MGMQDLTNIVYLIAAVLFILDLKMLAHPRTAVRGNQLGALGMVLAIVATLMSGTLGLDLHHPRHRHRLPHRSSGRSQGEDDLDAGDGRSVQRLRRRGVRAGRRFGAGRDLQRRQHRVCRRQHADEGRHRVVGHHRFGDLLRALRGLRQAGRVPVRQVEAPHLAEDRQVRVLVGRRRRRHLVRPDHGRQPAVRLLSWRRRLLIGGLLLAQEGPLPGNGPAQGTVRDRFGRARRDAGSRPVKHCTLLGPGGCRRRSRRHPDAVDRRRRYAGGDRAAELLLGSRRGRHRFRDQQHGADHRRLAGRAPRASS